MIRDFGKTLPPPPLKVTGMKTELFIKCNISEW